MTAKHVLTKYWGFKSFRPVQDEVVNSICTGHDTLALLPTGGGKSICFQVPALMLPGITVVISPLVSLMKDQVDALVKRGISATYLASSLSKTESQSRISQLAKNELKIIYVAPERLHNKKFLGVILHKHISQLVVDEAHCISEWGHTFRPNYLMIAEFIEQIKKRPVITAVTATATQQTVADILAQLRMNNPKVFRKSFCRNIHISIIKCCSSSEQEIHILRLLSKHRSKPGIIYCATRNDTQIICGQIKRLSRHIQISFYHGGMTAKDRASIQQKFLNNQLQILCATNAFGMGIDKADVEFVIHYQLPSSIEQYYQEIGRAGRSGQSAFAYLLFNKEQIAINKQLIDETVDISQRNKQRIKLGKMITLASKRSCITKSVMGYFGEVSKSCQMCTNCQKPCNEIRKYPTLSTLTSRKEKIALFKLLQWREFKANQIKSQPMFVLSDAQAQYLSLLHPRTIDELTHIRGMGAGWINCFGKELISSNWYRKLI